MVEKHPLLNFITWVLLIFSVVLICFPLYYAFVAATLSTEQISDVPMTLIPQGHFFENLSQAVRKGDLFPKLFNSFVVAIGISLGKILISLLSAFAITYFNFRFKKIFFFSIFLTLMLPVEVRILPTYEVASNVLKPINSLIEFFNSILGSQISITFDWSLINSYQGLILPLVASATATFLFRQFFMTVPDELCEAAKIDGATPMQFFFKILLPLSKTNIAALGVITFIYGWNQYLWPLLITTSPEMKTAVIGLDAIIPKTDAIPEWNITMAGALLVSFPPVLVVLLFQRYFVKGLLDSEK